MPTIRIDDEVFQGLQRIARPFVDSPNSVIRTLLEDKGVLPARAAPDARHQAEARPGALTPQSVFEQYLLVVIERDFKGRGHKRDVTAAVIKRMMGDGFIGPADQELVATGETKAENTITWGRNALKERGFISRQSQRGIWELTPEGRTAARAITLSRK